MQPALVAAALGELLPGNNPLPGDNLLPSDNPPLGNNADVWQKMDV